MNLFKFIRLTGFCTLLALVYIHMQMNIMDNAYQQEKQGRRIKELAEFNGNMRYVILRFKSANYIGDKIFADKSDMQFVDQANVVQVSSVQTVPENAQLGESKKNLSDSLLSFLGNGITK
ncbi:MAG: hypothetical protein HQL25_06075 [Candidatus Omnitrophica bacterium]|nr:hypothetical protein [Candidatus Omnitrophota bacterium]